MAIVSTKGCQKRSITSSEFAHEQELRDALAENSSLLTGDNERPLALIQKEVVLPTAGRLDILFVEDTGYPVAVEVKLKRNIQSRREVVAQAFDYTSDLSQLTSDELDELTEGNLEKALLSFDGESNTALLEARWRACGSNLRAGKVRLVIAVDEAPEDLTRIVQYINDHSDLDVRLVEVQKYKDSDGSLLFVPNTIVHGGIKEAPASPRTPKEMTREFAAVIGSYQGQAAQELQPRRTNSKVYRFMRFDRWPRALHYEFLDYSGSVGVEIHLEAVPLRPLAKTLADFVPIVKNEFNGQDVSFDPKWDNIGRLRVMFPKAEAPEKIANAMMRLIEVTYPKLDEELGKIQKAGTRC